MEYTTVAEHDPSWSRDTYQSNHRRFLTGEEVIEFTGGTELKCPSSQEGDARWIHWTFFKINADEYVLKLQEKCLSQDFKDCVICISVDNKIIDVTFFSDANEVVGCLLFDDGCLMSIKFLRISSDKSIFANYVNDGNAYSINDLADNDLLSYNVNINTQQKQIKKVSFLSKTEIIVAISTGEIMQISITINKDDVEYSTVMFGKMMQKLFSVFIGNSGKLDIIDMAVYGGQFLFVLHSSGNVQLWDVKTKSLLSENSIPHKSRILNGKIRINMLLNTLCVAIGINYENDAEIFYCKCENSDIEMIKIPLGIPDSSIQGLLFYVVDLNYMPNANGVDVIYKFETDNFVSYHRASCDFDSSSEIVLNECMKEETYIVDREVNKTDEDTDKILRAIMRPNRFRKNDIRKVMRRYDSRYIEISDNLDAIFDIVQKLHEIDRCFHCNILRDLEHLDQFGDCFYYLLPLTAVDMTIVTCNDDIVGIVHPNKMDEAINVTEKFVDNTKHSILSDSSCSVQLDRIKCGVFAMLNDTYDTSKLFETLNLEVITTCQSLFRSESFGLSSILAEISGKSDDQVVQLFDELIATSNCLNTIPKTTIPALSCLSRNIESGIAKKKFGHNIDKSLIVAIIFAFIYGNGGLNSNIKAALHARYLPFSICNIVKSSLILWLDTIRPCARTHGSLKYINTIDICPSSSLYPDIESTKVSPNFSVLVNFYRNTVITDDTEGDLDYALTSYLMKSGEFSCLIRLLSLLEYQNLIVRTDNSKFTSLKLFVQMIDRVCYYHAEPSIVDDAGILDSIKHICNKLINVAPKASVDTDSPWSIDTKLRVDKTAARDFKGYTDAHGDITNMAHLSNLLETSKRIRVLLPTKIGSEIALDSSYALLNAVIELLKSNEDTHVQSFLMHQLHRTWFNIFEISLDENLFDEAYTAIIEVLNLKDAAYKQTCIDCVSSLVTKVCDNGYLGWLCKISIPLWNRQAESFSIYAEIINTLLQLSDDIFMSNSMSNIVRSKQLYYYECLCCFLLYRQRFNDVHRTLYPLIKDFLIKYDYSNAKSIFHDNEKVESILNTLSIIIHSIEVVPPNQAFIVDDMDVITYKNLVKIFQQFLSITMLSSHNHHKQPIDSDEKIVIMLCAQKSVTQALNFCQSIEILDSAGVKKMKGKDPECKSVLGIIRSYYRLILDEIIANPSDCKTFNDLRLGGICTTSVSKTGNVNASINMLMDILRLIDTTPVLFLHQYVCNKLMDKYGSIALPLLNSFWKNSVHDKTGSDVALLTRQSGDVALLIRLLLDRENIATATEVMSHFLEEITATLEETTDRKCEILIPNTILDRLLNASPQAEKIEKLLKKYYTILSNKFR